MPSGTDAVHAGEQRTIVFRVRGSRIPWLASLCDHSLPRALRDVGICDARPAFSGDVHGDTLARRYRLDRYWIASVCGRTAVSAALEKLRGLAGVEVAWEENRYSYLTIPTPDDPAFTQQWNLRNEGQAGGKPDADIDADEAWKTTVGDSRILLAVLDSGIEGEHREIRRRLAPGGRDFYDWNDWNPELEPGDVHGLQTAGVAMAESNDDASISGVDWGVTLLPARVGDDSGVMGGALADALRWAVRRGARVINISSGGSPSELVHDAIRYAADAGAIIVAAAGNIGPGGVTYPAAYPEVIAVGATDNRDTRPSWSSVGSELELVAPGVDVPTLVRGEGDSWEVASGTSIACPEVAGAVSLLLSLDPTLTPEQVRDLLHRSADDQIGPPGDDLPGWDQRYGYGRLNVARAVDLLHLHSAGLVHVSRLWMRRRSDTTMEARVVVVDELGGAREGVRVEGEFTSPGGVKDAVGGVTGSQGLVVFEHVDGGGLESGRWKFRVLSVRKDSLQWDRAADERDEVEHDPDLDAVHVGMVEVTDDGSGILVDVQVVDDDDLPEGSVEVTGRLVDPTGAEHPLGGTSAVAAGGMAHMEYRPGGLTPGTWQYEVEDLSKPGYEWERDRDVERSEVHEVLDPDGDQDGDGVPNGSDVCPRAADPGQEDSDGDGFGDACDVCPSLPDPGQPDEDHDGVGDRCDGAPFDGSRQGLGEVQGVRVEGDHETVRWWGLRGADRYDVIRGNVAGLASGNWGTCVANDVEDVSWRDPGVPAAGEAWHYLVRGDDAIVGTGPLGWASDGTERVADCP